MKGDRPLMKAIAQVKNKDVQPWKPAPKAHRHVLLVLMSFASIYTDDCYPGIDLLVEHSGWSRRTIILVLEDLRRWGYVTRVECSKSIGNAGRTADRYRLNIAAISNAAKSLHGAKAAPKKTVAGCKNCRLHGATTAPQETISQETTSQARVGGLKNEKEQRWYSEITAFGIDGETALKMLRKHDINRLEGALIMVQVWPNVRDPKAAFLSCLKKECGSPAGIPYFPDDHDASKLQNWAKSRGMLEANTGELPDLYRQRLKGIVDTGSTHKKQPCYWCPHYGGTEMTAPAEHVTGEVRSSNQGSMITLPHEGTNTCKRNSLAQVIQ